jgi:putative addiction module component (TIGR02574 family)
MTREQNLKEAQSLDPSERQELIDDLRQTIDADDIPPELLAELRRRVEAIARGDCELLDGEQVMADLRKRFAK